MTDQERDKYSRQILFSELGETGQQRLLDSRAVIVGCGALGSFHAAALARAGVGEIVLIDRDYVEPSNLQRQWLFEESDAEQALPKAAAAAKRLAAINSAIKVESRIADLTPENAERLLLPAGVILDGCDNFDTRYLINDVAVKHGVPWVYGAAVGSYGITMPILPGCSACLACIFPQPPSGAQPTCDTAGILNSVVGAVAALQVADAVKILSGKVDAVEPRMLSIDVWENSLRTVSSAQADAECRVCAKHEFHFLNARRRQAATLCGRNAVHIHARENPVNLAELRTALENLGDVRANDYALRFSCPPHEMTIFADGRAIIKGTDDLALARSLYARYVGT